MKRILIPEQYQEDSEQSRKESKMKYVAMYDEEYVEKLVKQIETLSDTLYGSIKEHHNRGVQRFGIEKIARAKVTISNFRAAKDGKTK